MSTQVTESYRFSHNTLKFHEIKFSKKMSRMFGTFAHIMSWCAKVEDSKLLACTDPNKLYSLGNEIDAGSFGRVYTVDPLLKRNGSVSLCVKVIDVEDAVNALSGKPEDVLDEDAVLSMLRREIIILHEVRACSFVVKYVESFSWDGYYWIVTELCSPGSLQKVIKNIDLTELENVSVLYCVLQALKFIHDLHIVHGDVKLENLLIDVSGSVKLCDFGGASKCDENGLSSVKFLGTLPYDAPEVLIAFLPRDHKAFGPATYHQKRDIWALGVLCLALEDRVTRLHDICDMYGAKGLYNVVHYSTPSFFFPLEADYLNFYRPQEVSPERVVFMKASLVLDYRSRPSASDLLTYPCFRDSNIDKIYQLQLLNMIKRASKVKKNGI